MKVLELGGGISRHSKAEFSLDLHHPYPPYTEPTDICDIWPVGDESYDLVYSSHVLEHIPKGDAIINVFNEALRVLKPGGRFVNILPIVGYENTMVSAWMPYADPTHVQFWWLPESVDYFTGNIVPEAHYGIHAGWKHLGPRLRDDTAERERNSVAATGAAFRHDTWWSVTNNWEGAFSLVKER